MLGGAGDRHSIVQANYQWKIITTDGSRLVLEHPGAPQQMMKPESAVGGREGGGGRGEGCPAVAHKHTQTHTSRCDVWPGRLHKFDDQAGPQHPHMAPQVRRENLEPGPSSQVNQAADGRRVAQRH